MDSHETFRDVVCFELQPKDSNDLKVPDAFEERGDMAVGRSERY